MFGGWIPFPESERHGDLETQWICTKSLSVLHLGQFGYLALCAMFPDCFKLQS